MSASRQHHPRMFGLAGHADAYERHAARIGGRLYDRVRDDVLATGLPAGARILDVGTGPGLVPLRIAAAAGQFGIDAIDLAPEMIEQARASASREGHTSIDFALGDVSRLQFADRSFDLVISSLSQHHWSDPAAGLVEIARVLQPGATAWIYDVRWALGRAERATQGLDPRVSVRRQSPLPGTPWYNPIGRLVLRAQPDAQPDAEPERG